MFDVGTTSSIRGDIYDMCTRKDKIVFDAVDFRLCCEMLNK